MEMQAMRMPRNSCSVGARSKNHTCGGQGGRSTCSDLTYTDRRAVYGRLGPKASAAIRLCYSY
eukprot:1181301-Prorocentrum_minimum.AAC.2